MGERTLNDKVILITGGARGIGAATARELARRGARLALADLDTEALASTAAAMSPRPLTIELDVTDAAACGAAVERVVGEHGRLDLIWANAGIASFGPLQLTDPAAWTRTVALFRVEGGRGSARELAENRGRAVRSGRRNHPSHLDRHRHGPRGRWLDPLLPGAAIRSTAAAQAHLSGRASRPRHRRRVRAAPATNLQPRVPAGDAGPPSSADHPAGRAGRPVGGT